MSDWIYDPSGRPQVIVDGDRFLNRNGNSTVGWIDGTATFTLTGQPAGWYENGVLWDLKNQLAGFTEAATDVPSRPEITQTRPMPDLVKRPSRPELEPAPDRPPEGEFSTVPLDYLFDDAKPLAPSFYEDIQGV